MPSQDEFTTRLRLFTPKEVIYYLSYAAQKKVAYSVPQLLVLSFQAGMFISIAALFATLVAYGSHGITDENPGIKKLLYGSVFPVGLILVVLYGGELFTGNIMVLPPAYLMGQVTLHKMMRNLIVVYVGNFVSSVVLAYFLAHLSGLSHDEDFSSSIAHYIEDKIALGFGRVFLRAIGCNFLVCLATYISTSSTDIGGKVLAIYFPTMTFSGVGFEHSIANMFLIPMGMLEDADVSVGEFIGLSIIPSTLGNMIGGGIFVGLAAWYVHTDAYTFFNQGGGVKNSIHIELTDRSSDPRRDSVLTAEPVSRV
eukprot:TRINITY_DN17543_c0_g1_i1.p1 TRINITY_DN17543_c0_g1~~TRINITY_DN17543_c0_g1_i1.p1  ORF type:complete len:310 (+),score=69.68 TRINITY_DN17543_c0_g1_i1:61-990(+)